MQREKIKKKQEKEKPVLPKCGHLSPEQRPGGIRALAKVGTGTKPGLWRNSSGGINSGKREAEPWM